MSYFEDVTRFRQCCRTNNQAVVEIFSTLSFPLKRRKILQITTTPEVCRVVEIVARVDPLDLSSVQITSPEQIEGGRFQSVVIFHKAYFCDKNISDDFLKSIKIITKEISFPKSSAEEIKSMLPLFQAEQVKFPATDLIDFDDVVRELPRMGVFQLYIRKANTLPTDCLDIFLNLQNVRIVGILRGNVTHTLVDLILKMKTGRCRLRNFYFPIGSGILHFCEEEENELGLDTYLLFEDVKSNFWPYGRYRGHLVPCNDKLLLLVKNFSRTYGGDGYIMGCLVTNLEEAYHQLEEMVNFKYFVSWAKKAVRDELMKYGTKEFDKKKFVQALEDLFLL